MKRRRQGGHVGDYVAAAFYLLPLAAMLHWLLALPFGLLFGREAMVEWVNSPGGYLFSYLLMWVVAYFLARRPWSSIYR